MENKGNKKMKLDATDKECNIFVSYLNVSLSETSFN